MSTKLVEKALTFRPGSIILLLSTFSHLVWILESSNPSKAPLEIISIYSNIFLLLLFGFVICLFIERLFWSWILQKTENEE